MTGLMSIPGGGSLRAMTQPPQWKPVQPLGQLIITFLLYKQPSLPSGVLKPQFLQTPFLSHLTYK